jgi:hypothetical protein
MRKKTSTSAITHGDVCADFGIFVPIYDIIKAHKAIHAGSKQNFQV